MSQSPGTSAESIKRTKRNPKVSLDIYYASGFLYVRLTDVKELNVTSGKVYARSSLRRARKSDNESGGDDSDEVVERRSENVNATASSSFEVVLSVSKE